MRTLQRNEIEEVDESLKPLVLSAWDKGEEVPWSVCLVRIPKPEQLMEIAKAYNFPPHPNPGSWINEERFKWFNDGYDYACTQTKALPCLSKVRKEELYFAVWAIVRGAKKKQHDMSADLK